MKKRSNLLSTEEIMGMNIKKIRTSRKVTQEKLAEQIGKSPHFISLIERGQCGLSIATIIAICKALKTDANAIFYNIIDPCDVSANPVSHHFNTLTPKEREIVTYIMELMSS